MTQKTSPSNEFENTDITPEQAKIELLKRAIKYRSRELVKSVGSAIEPCIRDLVLARIDVIELKPLSASQILEEHFPSLLNSNTYEAKAMMALYVVCRDHDISLRQKQQYALSLMKRPLADIKIMARTEYNRHRNNTSAGYSSVDLTTAKLTGRSGIVYCPQIT